MRGSRFARRRLSTKLRTVIVSRAIAVPRRRPQRLLQRAARPQHERRIVLDWRRRLLYLLIRAVLHPGRFDARAAAGRRAAGDAADDVVGQLIARDTMTVRSFVESLRLAKRDPRITGVLLMPASLESPFWGKVQELRDAVLDFRQSGKVVVAFLEFGGDRGTTWHRGGPRLPAADERARLTGTSRRTKCFLRGTFDKLGAYPDFLQIGAYKTAVNQFTQKSFTPAHREMTESLNSDMYEQLVRASRRRAGRPRPRCRQLLDQGPFLPEDAVRLGLVDGLAYDDQLDDRRSAAAAGRRDAAGGRHRLPARHGAVARRPAGVAHRGALRVGRGLHRARAATTRAPARSSAPTRSSKQLRGLRDVDTIRAIVLRVTAPAGSSVASDVMWRELMITREPEPSRPLVTSMSDLAASGGYYIRCPAGDVAQPGTLTGPSASSRQVRPRRHLNKWASRPRRSKSGKNSEISRRSRASHPRSA